jgi:prefoldin subunit 5
MRNFSTESKKEEALQSYESRSQKIDASARQSEDKIAGKEEHSTTRRSCFAQYGYREAAEKLN